MEKIKVVEVEVYRDGGSVVYEDELNRRYFTYNYMNNKKVYNQMPYSRGGGTLGYPPDKWVKEIPVELDIIDSF